MVIISLVSPFRKSEWRRLITWVIFSAQRLCFLGNIHRVPTLKQHLASRTSFDPGSLPYNRELLKWLQQQRAQGRRLVLCTASDLSIATAISEHLGMFDEVMASDGRINLSGQRKADALKQRFGAAGFDYAGNSIDDLSVWHHARRAILVNASVDLARKVALQCEVEHLFPSPPIDFSTWRRILRLHQWLKNLLLFVPLLAAHQFTNSASWLLLILAFFSFSLCASSVYIVNDLLDLASDRVHLRKRNRPFASGLVPVWMGVVLASVLLFTSFALAHYVGGSYLPWMGFYFLLTCAYSWGLKRLVIIDCLILAILYTLRIIAGAAAVSVTLSFWLLAFSIFLFLSLAFVKRFAELEVQLLNGQEKTHGRGYYTTDANLIQTMGITSGYAAVLVLSLYLNSDSVLKLYSTPEAFWGCVPIMLFWISWIWMQAHRGRMHDDPLVFAVKDKVSWLTVVVFSIFLTAATLGLP